MAKLDLTLKDIVYLVTLVISMASIYFNLQARVDKAVMRTDNLQVEVEKHSKSFEAYQPALFDYKLQVIQNDVAEIKRILKEDGNY